MRASVETISSKPDCFPGDPIPISEQIRPGKITADYSNRSLGIAMYLECYADPSYPSNLKVRLEPKVKDGLKGMLTYSEYWEKRFDDYNQFIEKIFGGNRGRKHLIDKQAAMDALIKQTPEAEKLDKLAVELRNLGLSDLPIDQLWQDAVRLIAEQEEIIYGKEYKVETLKRFGLRNKVA